MRKSIAFILCGVILSITNIVTADVAKAETKPFTLDKGHAYLGFEANHQDYSTTIGQFRDFDGTFLIDEANPEKSKISFTVKTNSLDTNNDDRDNHLKSKDFLNTGIYPDLKFQSTKVLLLTPTSGKLYGDLTMLGVTKPVMLNFHITKDAPYPAFIPGYDQIRAVGFEVTGQIIRLDYGMNFVGFVGSPVGPAIDIKANFDLLDCTNAKATNIPCHWHR